MEKLNKEQAIRDLKLFYGMPPYDTGTNELKMKASLLSAIIQTYGLPFEKLKNDTGFNVLLNAWQQRRQSTTSNTMTTPVTLDSIRYDLHSAQELITQAAADIVAQEHLFRNDDSAVTVMFSNALDIANASALLSDSVRRASCLRMTPATKTTLTEIPHL